MDVCPAIALFVNIAGQAELPENIPADARIFVRVNGEVNYEAFPVTNESGQESFSLMLITELLSGNNTYELCLVPASELAAE